MFKTFLIFTALAFFCNFSFATEENCQSLDQGNNMCKGFGFCTMYPLGKDGQSCGVNWKIPEGFRALSLDCLKNLESNKTYNCKNGGKVSSVICGKSNCYTCVCN